jgi:hypothetical protein
MSAPRWLQVVVCMAMFNAVMVAASLAHRHLLAVEAPAIQQEEASNLPQRQQASSNTEKEPETPENDAELSPQEKLLRLAPPVLQNNPQPVAEDDPLMAEIRKQLADKFPVLSVVPTSQDSGVTLPPNQPTGLSQQQSRLIAVGQLSTAASGLLQLSSELRESGNSAEADKLVLQAQQLQTTIRELMQ